LITVAEREDDGAAAVELGAPGTAGPPGPFATSVEPDWQAQARNNQSIVFSFIHQRTDILWTIELMNTSPAQIHPRKSTPLAQQWNRAAE
jgi:hypothetical protein